jgi:hypothetical protein
VDLEVRLEGYATAERLGFRIGAGSSPLDLGVVVLQKGVRLAGKVVTGQGEAVGGAEVFVFERAPFEAAVEDAVSGRTPDATTGSDGGFALDDLRRGFPKSPVVRAQGFLAAVVRGVRPPTAQPVVVRLERGSALAGHVVDERMAPVPRARVDLMLDRAVEGDPYGRPLRRPVSREAVADANGRFTIREVPAGSAVLRASAEGMVLDEEVKVEVPPQDPAALIMLRLRGGAVVWGRVSTTAGYPVKSARVLAVEYGSLWYGV